MRQKSLLIIFFIVFIDLVGFGIIIPVLPYYAESYGASGLDLGFLMMCYSGMQFLFAPFWGRLSDRHGRRPILLISLFGIGVSMLLFGWAPSLTWLFIARMLGGMFGANISTAMAYVADVTPPEERARGMGMIGAAFGLGFLFGPAIGGFLSGWGYGWTGYGAALLSGINLIVAFFILKEPVSTFEVRAQHRHQPTLQLIRQTLARSQTGLAILMFFLVTMGIAQMETIFGLFLLERFAVEARGAGMILAAMAIVMVIIQGGVIGRLVKRFGETNLIMMGAVMMALALFGAARSMFLFGLIAFLILQALGYALTTPSLQGLVSRSAPQQVQGATMGVYHSAGSLARILGPLIAGWSYDVIGMETPFFIAAGFFGAVMGLMRVSKKKYMI